MNWFLRTKEGKLLGIINHVACLPPNPSGHHLTCITLTGPKVERLVRITGWELRSAIEHCGRHGENCPEGCKTYHGLDVEATVEVHSERTLGLSEPEPAPDEACPWCGEQPVETQPGWVRCPTYRCPLGGQAAIKNDRIIEFKRENWNIRAKGKS